MVELSWEIKELEDGNAQRMKDKDEKLALPTDIDAIQELPEDEEEVPMLLKDLESQERYEAK